MDVLIWHHSFEYPDRDNHIKEITRLRNLPDNVSVQGESVSRVTIRDDNLIIFVDEAPVRIDRDPFFNTVYLLSPEGIRLYPEPKVLIAEKGEGIVVWEYGERERVTLEEVGELGF